MSVIIDIADAVVTTLNGAALSQSVAATRAYLPIQDLDALTALKVSVVPRGLLISNAARQRDSFDHEIDIAVQKKVADFTTATLDPLVQLVEEIADLFRGKRMAAYDAAICVDVRNVPVYAPDHLDKFRVFTSVLTLGFRNWR